MTEPLNTWFESAPTQLVQLRRLCHELSQALEPLPPDGSVLNAPSAALERLLSGRGQPNDPLVMGLPIQDARIVVVRIEEPTNHDAVLRTLQPLDRVRLVSGPRAQEITLLVPDIPKHAGQGRSRTSSVQLAQLALAHHSNLQVGISSPATAPRDLPSAVAEAQDAAAMAPRQGYLLADQHWAELSIARLRRQLASSLTISNPLRDLREHDDRHDTAFCQTIAAWLDADGDCQTTARALNVHPNTLRYRLQRIRELAGLDLRNPDMRALAHLALGLPAPVIAHVGRVDGRKSAAERYVAGSA